MKKLLGLCAVWALLFGSCVTAHEGIEADIAGFSDGVYGRINVKNYNKKGKNMVPPFTISNTEGLVQMKNTVDMMRPQDVNTSLYFAKDFAAKRVKFVRKKILKRDPDARIYMIIMTDGLENSSLQAAKNNHFGRYGSIQKYQKAVKKRTKKAMGKHNFWQVYPIVFIGQDLVNSFKDNNINDEKSQQEFIKREFEPMRGAKGAPLKKNDNVSPEVITSTDVEQLAEHFRQEFTAASFGFHIPKGYVDQKVKMQFFTDESGDKPAGEFAGIYKKKGSKYIFKITEKSNGLTFLVPNKKNVLKSTNKKKSDLISKFEVNRLRLNDKFIAIDNKNVKQFVLKSNGAKRKDSDSNDGLWIWNSEYDAQAGTTTNAYIITLLDGSKSILKEDAQNEEDRLEVYRKMQGAMRQMIFIATGMKTDNE